MCVALGGRLAEEIINGRDNVTTGWTTEWEIRRISREDFAVAAFILRAISQVPLTTSSSARRTDMDCFGQLLFGSYFWPLAPGGQDHGHAAWHVTGDWSAPFGRSAAGRTLHGTFPACNGRKQFPLTDMSPTSKLNESALRICRPIGDFMGQGAPPMSQASGMQQCGTVHRHTTAYRLPTGAPPVLNAPLSRSLSGLLWLLNGEALKKTVDSEVKRIVDEQYQRGMKLLRVPCPKRKTSCARCRTPCDGRQLRTICTFWTHLPRP